MAGILLLPLWVCAQGVNFRPLSYTEAIELAAKENKMVFIDFYTTWCGPCKRMSKEVFPQQEVGEYFNRTFISLKLDAEKENGLVRRYSGPPAIARPMSLWRKSAKGSIPDGHLPD